MKLALEPRTPTIEDLSGENVSVVSDPSDPLLGVVVHDYVIQKELARGGMGAVYLARFHDPRSPSRMVVKVLHAHLSQHPAFRERFEQEALAVMRLAHPYIVRIHHFGRLPDGQLYLMMDYLEGETLEAHLHRRGRCTLHHTLHVIAQVMSALLSMHERGLVHRDLKPENIFIVCTEQNPYEVRLIDLGIVRDLVESGAARKTITGMTMGTPGYMAPEQYQTAADATTAADVYAAAVIVWRMLMGRPPWGDVSDDRAMYFRQRAEDFEIPSDHNVPPEVIALLRKALTVEPKERPSVGDFVALLASYTPAIPPHVPSGAMILNDVAKRFIKHASTEGETVRNVSHPAIATPLSWPHRRTSVPEFVGGAGLHQPAAALPTPANVPTSNERPAAAHRARTTTPSGANGEGPVPSAPETRRGRTILAGVACLLVGVTAFVIVQVTSGSARSAEHDAGATSSPLPARKPASALPVPVPVPMPASSGNATPVPEPSAGTVATPHSVTPAAPPRVLDTVGTPAHAAQPKIVSSPATIGESARTRPALTKTAPVSPSAGPASPSTTPLPRTPPSGSNVPPPKHDENFDPNALVE